MTKFRAQWMGWTLVLFALGCADNTPEASNTLDALSGPEPLSESAQVMDDATLTDGSTPSESGGEDVSIPLESDTSQDVPGEEEVSSPMDAVIDDVEPSSPDTTDAQAQEKDGGDTDLTPVDEDIEDSTEEEDGEEILENDTVETDTVETDTVEADTVEADTDETPIEPGPNLIQNPGFEDGDDFWGIWGGAQRVEGDAVTGNWAIRATNGNGAEQLVTGLEPNATYRLTAWGKVEGAESMLVGVKDHGGNQKAIHFTTEEYEEGTMTFNTGFSNTSAVIFAYKHTGGEPGHADDISLQLESLNAKTPVWSDEFNGEGPLDETKWGFEKGFVRNEELQWYQSDNAFQEDGMLVIEGRTEDKPNPGYDPLGTTWQSQIETIEYTSSSVITKDLFTFQYGTLVVRAKVTNLEGTWPAIWTLGTECKWPSRGEVDVMENYGGNILANFAWGTNTPWQPFWDSSSWPVSGFGEGWVDDFHIWELRWTPENMTILLDGAVLNDVSLSETVNGSWECAGENPFQQPHYILLNLALGSAGGSVGNLEFPTRYLVDYVRIYE